MTKKNNTKPIFRRHSLIVAIGTSYKRKRKAIKRSHLYSTVPTSELHTVSLSPLVGVAKYIKGLAEISFYR